MTKTVGKPTDPFTVLEIAPMGIFRFALGVEVKDKVSGFTGIVTGRSEFLNGCIRYSVEHRTLTKEGARKDVEHFDEGQLELGKGKPVVVSRPASAPPGGPRRDIPRGPDISR